MTTSVLNGTSFIKWFKVFIIFQPIIDVFTYLSITYWKIDLTLGILVRVLFMGLTLIYIFWGNQHQLKKKVITYLVALMVVVGLSFILNFITKPNYLFVEEVKFTVKTVYFPVMFCGLLLTLSNIEHKNQLLKATMVAMLIFSVSLLIAVLTGTSGNTYRWSKAGYSGWFFAGNEIGAIIAITLPLILNYSISKTKTIKDLVYWLPSLLLAFSGLLIGTKVSYLSVIVSILGATVIIVLNVAINFKDAVLKKKYTTVLLAMVSFLIVLLVTLPLVPAFENIKTEYNLLNQVVVEEKSSTNDPGYIEESNNTNEIQEEGNIPNNQTESIISSPVLKTILSSRNSFFEKIYLDYSKSDFLQKILGIGYAGYYGKDNPKLVEMDFFDIFFSFGILGFLVIFVPFFLAIGLSVKTLLTNPKGFFMIEYILLILSVALGFGIAFIAGHVISAPAVSIYLALSLVFLVSYNKKWT